jgi:hypothetical protein
MNAYLFFLGFMQFLNTSGMGACILVLFFADNSRKEIVGFACFIGFFAANAAAIESLIGILKNQP